MENTVLYNCKIYIIDDIKQYLYPVFSKYNVKKAVLFGSYVKGNANKNSDIDLAVSGGTTVEFTLDVEECTNTLLKFDVVNLDGAVQQELLEIINKEGKIVYEKI